MSNVFEGYERHYCELSANLSKMFTAAVALNGELKKQKVSEIKAGIDEAEALIQKMNLEARNLLPSVEAALLAKLREYMSDMNNLKSEVKKILSGKGITADQRARLMMSTERLNRSSKACLLI